jgi:hypothetical protein
MNLIEFGWKMKDIFSVHDRTHRFQPISGNRIVDQIFDIVFHCEYNRVEFMGILILRQIHNNRNFCGKFKQSIFIPEITMKAA